MQMKHEKTDVFRAIVSMEERATLKKGDTVHRPYRSAISVQTYTRGTAFTVQDLTDTDESLQVSVSKIAPFYVDDLDALQHNYAVLNSYADDAAVQLGNWIDGDVLGEYDQAASKVGLYDMGGGGSLNDGVGFTVTTTNIQKVFAVAARKLNKQNIGQANRFAVISPEFYQVLLEYLAGKESTLGDSTGVNGHVGKYFGFDLYVSNATGWSAELDLTTIPVAGDTITINGVQMQAAADNSATNPGDFSIETTNDLAAANLVLLINGTGTPGADEYIDLSAANRALLSGITASYNSSTNILSLKAEGKGYVAVSETLTPAGDIWTTTKQVQHCLFGQKGAIDLVIQKAPNVEVKEVQDKLGRNVAPWTLYGLKTFREGTFKLVDVLVRSDAY